MVFEVGHDVIIHWTGRASATCKYRRGPRVAPQSSPVNPGVGWFLLGDDGAIITSRLVNIFGLELYIDTIRNKTVARDNQLFIVFHLSFAAYNRHIYIYIAHGRPKLTLPEMGPSWAFFPFTVKVTPLGALDLTSRLAASNPRVSFSRTNSL